MTVVAAETALACAQSRSLDLEKYAKYLLEVCKAKFVLNEFYQNTMTRHYNITPKGAELFDPLHHRPYYFACKTQKKPDAYYAAATPSDCFEFRMPLAVQLLVNKRTKPSTKSGCKNTQELVKPTAIIDEEYENDICRIWGPPQTAKQPLDDKATRVTAQFLTDEALGAWVCPEIDIRARRERVRRRRAMQLVKRIAAPRLEAPAENDIERKIPRGRKRRLSDTPEPEAESKNTAEQDTLNAMVENLAERAHSPEIIRPQSLLIPELLPQGMFRSTKAPMFQSLPNEKPPELTQDDSLPLTMPVIMMESADDQLGLGLDLGFDIAQQAEGVQGYKSSPSIMEIADFLEKDIDVFTPLNMPRRSKKGRSVFSVPLTSSPPPSHDLPANLMSDDDRSWEQSWFGGAGDKQKEKDLIGDILNMTF
ncbi:hypothetical protein LPJ66_004885 [Kickxella alabastrina]|uniref:Uncharacterized protein n=1 Tax=Kickxella alabastrina TaxID=61397 RepID=A0ACC1IGR3_9FUNG|nr:hypothetical protein LPJ66_004885 [Kickxella alabastrina]